MIAVTGIRLLTMDDFVLTGWGGRRALVQRDLLGRSPRARRFRLARRNPSRFLWIDGDPHPVVAGGAANTSPVFALAPNIGFATITAANTATDGTGTVATIFTAGANGSLVERVKCVPMGTNTASKAYIFINNGGATTTAANNALWLDLVLAAATASNTALIGAPVEVVMALPLKASYLLTATLATAVAAGVKITAIGADF